MWHLYIIKKNGRYYTGITTDPKNRLRQHGNPSILYQETFSDKFQAAKREKQIKAYSVAKKKNLITKSSR